MPTLIGLLGREAAFRNFVGGFGTFSAFLSRDDRDLKIFPGISFTALLERGCSLNRKGDDTARTGALSCAALRRALPLQL